MNHPLTMRTDRCSGKPTKVIVLAAETKGMCLRHWRNHWCLLIKPRTSGYLERRTSVSTRGREAWFSVDLCFMVEWLTWISARYELSSWQKYWHKKRGYKLQCKAFVPYYTLGNQFLNFSWWRSSGYWGIRPDQSFPCSLRSHSILFLQRLFSLKTWEYKISVV